jgi:hypothetical protein
MVESPPHRRAGTRYHIKGAGDHHVSQFDHPAIAAIIRDLGAAVVVFDQCRTVDDPTAAPQKTTGILASRAVLAPVRSR